MHTARGRRLPRRRRHADVVVGIVSEWRRYRKKPVVIRAKQLEEKVEIATREGTVVGYPGDYLIEGVEGERYPCGEEIFEQTYELVDDD